MKCPHGKQKDRFLEDKVKRLVARIAMELARKGPNLDKSLSPAINLANE